MIFGAVSEETVYVYETGCIHTCQGLVFDYVGVINGDDLCFEIDSVITDYIKRVKADHSIKGIKKKIKKYPKEAPKQVNVEVTTSLLSLERHSKTKKM